MATRQHLGRFFALVACALVAAFAQAEQVWLGLFIGQDKLGYTFYETTNAPGSSTPQKRVSKTILTGKMLGQDLNISVLSTTFFTRAGDLDSQTFHMSSGGREIDVTAKYTKQTVEVETSESGTKKKKTLPIPPGGVVKDDPTADLIEGKATGAVCYIFDPQAITLVKTTVTKLPDEEVDTPQGKAKAHVVNVEDPRAPTKVYLSTKGDLIKAEGPFGMVMRPITEAEALAAGGDLTDIAEASTIPVDGDLGDWNNAKKLSFLFVGPKLNKAPSDGHQTVVKQGDNWLVEVHPVTWHSKTATIKSAAQSQGQWTKPEPHVPSDQKRFTDLAKKIVGEETKVSVAAEKIRKYVHGLVAANAGIGVVRDAEEILESKEGVCRDHAVLMTTILRAAGIPTRVCTGIVQYAGSFYYHAWVEVFDGTNWVALDSTRDPAAVDPTHIKTAQGSVGEAFTSFILDRGRAKVVKK